MHKASKQSRERRPASGNRLVPLMRSILLVAGLASLRVANASYAISIDPKSEECFVYVTPSDVSSTSTITGSFEVLHDDVDSYELAVKIADLKSGESLYEVPLGTQEGDFKLENLKASSRFSICFQNHASDNDDDNEFDVGFNVRFHKPARTLDDGESGPDGERASQLAEKASEIHQDWDILEDHFDFLRNREGIHYQMNDKIMKRLSNWTYVEAALVIFMAVGQVMYWKKFFEKRRYL
eukprot:CAMPEP_0197183298 /NCGR_PEP_ID=MMETSP1423-20130617/7740_1 /TAXON_ID=476441 /ORGANISM="Pseudo-nitzschia heimii, Strain UNC1101" /LENGTH=238 /DNA_ID=CAMNT_0042633863 /DNA_START=81 /DNA_END=797 /DNA_ORIENTATION=-